MGLRVAQSKCETVRKDGEHTYTVTYIVTYTQHTTHTHTHTHHKNDNEA